MTAVVTAVLAAIAPKHRGRHASSAAIYYRAVSAVFATRPR
jgi:hypothetical protein